jgi:hypothetical protein
MEPEISYLFYFVEVIKVQFYKFCYISDILFYEKCVYNTFRDIQN